MSKIAGLLAAQELLTVMRTNAARHYLLGWARHPSDPPAEQRLVSTSLLLAEIEDHLHNLNGIVTACRHALAGTVPDDFYLSPSEYDPWAIIAEHLADEHRLPVAVLTPALVEWLDARPEVARQSSARIMELFGADSTFFAWTRGEDGRLRPATDAERQAAPERDMLASIEQTVFTLTYAADLAELAAISASRKGLPTRPVALARVLALAT